MFCALLTSRYQVSVYRTNGPLVYFRPKYNCTAATLTTATAATLTTATAATFATAAICTLATAATLEDN